MKLSEARSELQTAFLYVIEENYGFIPVLAIITADNAITAVI
mgnify:FL=1